MSACVNSLEIIIIICVEKRDDDNVLDLIEGIERDDHHVMDDELLRIKSTSSRAEGAVGKKPVGASRSRSDSQVMSRSCRACS